MAQCMTIKPLVKYLVIVAADTRVELSEAVAEHIDGSRPPADVRQNGPSMRSFHAYVWVDDPGELLDWFVTSTRWPHATGDLCWFQKASIEGTATNAVRVCN